MSTVLGGSTAAGNQGGTPDPNAGGNPAGGADGGAAGGSGAAGSGAAGGSSTPSWRDSLSPELRSNPAIQTFDSVENLTKSYIHAQSSIGKKGVFVPGEKATDEEWSGFFKGIGVPELEKFHVEQPKDSKMAPERLGKFKEMAHKAGLLPRQAQAILNDYAEYEKGLVSDQVKQIETAQKEQLGKLKQEWGDGYDKQVAYANYVVNEIGGESFAKYLTQTGLGNDVNLIKVFAKLGVSLGGDKALAGQGSGNMGQTPAEIQSQIDAIMGNAKHPYFDTAHPGHAGAIQQMEELYKKLYTRKTG